MGARDAASRLRALPPDATATEVLCAAIGCDRRGLSALPRGAGAALADVVADTDALEALCLELDEAEASFLLAADRMPEGRARSLALSWATDYDEVAHRVRTAIGGAS